MTILKKIWSFINSKFFPYVIVIILILLLAKQCQSNRDLKIDNKIKDQNIAAADTTIKIYKNKNGQLTAEKSIWILSEKELKKQNKSLYDQVNSQKGRIISLNNTILKLVQDTTLLLDSIRYLHEVIGKSEQISTDEWKLPWLLTYNWDNTNYDIFKGYTIAKIDTVKNSIENITTKMIYRESQIDLTFGEKVVNGKYAVYITTKYPGLSPKSMNGVLIDPNNSPIKDLIKKEHWFQGFSIGIGITPTWDFIYQRPTIVIGPTLSYSIYNF